MDESRAYGPRGAVWDHTVIVVVPKKLEHTNISTVWLTWDCNEKAQDPIKQSDLDVIVTDEWASQTHSITVAVKNLPNCHYVFPNDPTKKSRHEDAILAESWRQYLDDPEHKSDWLV